MNAQLPGKVHSEIAVAEQLPNLPPALQEAFAEARKAELAFGGQVAPKTAWQLFVEHKIKIVDVRSAEEIKFVGQVPGSINVAWKNGMSLSRNPRFVKELENALDKNKNTPALLLCRSGKRSVEAAIAATQAGFPFVFNILEGFEGSLNEQHQRGRINGWRVHGLPWNQE